MRADESPAVTSRIDNAVEEALLAFWAKVAEAFPEAKSGDFPFDAVHQQNEMSRSAVHCWLRYNTNLLLPEVDSPEWFEKIAETLRGKGYDANAEHTGGGIICITVLVPQNSDSSEESFTLYFGTANEIWGFDVYSNRENPLEGYTYDEDLTNEYALNPATQMTLSSETPDPEKCAEQLANTVEIFRKDRGL